MEAEGSFKKMLPKVAQFDAIGGWKFRGKGKVSWERRVIVANILGMMIGHLITNRIFIMFVRLVRMRFLCRGSETCFFWGVDRTLGCGPYSVLYCTLFFLSCLCLRSFGVPDQLLCVPYFAPYKQRTVHTREKKIGVWTVHMLNGSRINSLLITETTVCLRLSI